MAVKNRTTITVTAKREDRGQTTENRGQRTALRLPSSLFRLLPSVPTFRRPSVSRSLRLPSSVLVVRSLRRTLAVTLSASLLLTAPGTTAWAETNQASNSLIPGSYDPKDPFNLKGSKPPLATEKLQTDPRKAINDKGAANVADVVKGAMNLGQAMQAFGTRGAFVSNAPSSYIPVLDGVRTDNPWAFQTGAAAKLSGLTDQWAYLHANLANYNPRVHGLALQSQVHPGLAIEADPGSGSADFVMPDLTGTQWQRMANEREYREKAAEVYEQDKGVYDEMTGQMATLTNRADLSRINPRLVVVAQNLDMVNDTLGKVRSSVGEMDSLVDQMRGAGTDVTAPLREQLKAKAADAKKQLESTDAQFKEARERLKEAKEQIAELRKTLENRLKEVSDPQVRRSIEAMIKILQGYSDGIANAEKRLDEAEKQVKKALDVVVRYEQFASGGGVSMTDTSGAMWKLAGAGVLAVGGLALAFFAAPLLAGAGALLVLGAGSTGLVRLGYHLASEAVSELNNPGINRLPGQANLSAQTSSVEDVEKGVAAAKKALSEIELGSLQAAGYSPEQAKAILAKLADLDRAVRDDIAGRLRSGQVDRDAEAVKAAMSGLTGLRDQFGRHLETIRAISEGRHSPQALQSEADSIAALFNNSINPTLKRESRRLNAADDRYAGWMRDGIASAHRQAGISFTDADARAFMDSWSTMESGNAPVYASLPGANPTAHANYDRASALWSYRDATATVSLKEFELGQLQSALQLRQQQTGYLEGIGMRLRSSWGEFAAGRKNVLDLGLDSVGEVAGVMAGGYMLIASVGTQYLGRVVSVFDREAGFTFELGSRGFLGTRGQLYDMARYYGFSNATSDANGRLGENAAPGWLRRYAEHRNQTNIDDARIYHPNQVREDRSFNLFSILDDPRVFSGIRQSGIDSGFGRGWVAAGMAELLQMGHTAINVISVPGKVLGMALSFGFSREVAGTYKTMVDKWGDMSNTQRLDAIFDMGATVAGMAVGGKISGLYGAQAPGFFQGLRSSFGNVLVDVGSVALGSAVSSGLGLGGDLGGLLGFSAAKGMVHGLGAYAEKMVLRQSQLSEFNGVEITDGNRSRVYGFLDNFRGRIEGFGLGKLAEPEGKVDLGPSWLGRQAIRANALLHGNWSLSGVKFDGYAVDARQLSDYARDLSTRPATDPLAWMAPVRAWASNFATDVQGGLNLNAFSPAEAGRPASGESRTIAGVLNGLFERSRTINRTAEADMAGRPESLGDVQSRARQVAPELAEYERQVQEAQRMLDQEGRLRKMEARSLEEFQKAPNGLEIQRKQLEGHESLIRSLRDQKAVSDEAASTEQLMHDPRYAKAKAGESAAREAIDASGSPELRAETAQWRAEESRLEARRAREQADRETDPLKQQQLRLQAELHENHASRERATLRNLRDGVDIATEESRLNQERQSIESQLATNRRQRQAQEAQRQVNRVESLVLRAATENVSAPSDAVREARERVYGQEASRLRQGETATDPAKLERQVNDLAERLNSSDAKPVGPTLTQVHALAKAELRKAEVDADPSSTPRERRQAAREAQAHRDIVQAEQTSVEAARQRDVRTRLSEMVDEQMRTIRDENSDIAEKQAAFARLQVLRDQQDRLTSDPHMNVDTLRAAVEAAGPRALQERTDGTRETLSENQLKAQADQTLSAITSKGGIVDADINQRLTGADVGRSRAKDRLSTPDPSNPLQRAVRAVQEWRAGYDAQIAKAARAVRDARLADIARRQTEALKALKSRKADVERLMGRDEFWNAQSKSREVHGIRAELAGLKLKVDYSDPRAKQSKDRLLEKWEKGARDRLMRGFKVESDLAQATYKGDVGNSGAQRRMIQKILQQANQDPVAREAIERAKKNDAVLREADLAHKALMFSHTREGLVRLDALEQAERRLKDTTLDAAERAGAELAFKEAERKLQDWLSQANVDGLPETAMTKTGLVQIRDRYLKEYGDTAQQIGVALARQLNVARVEEYLAPKESRIMQLFDEHLGRQTGSGPRSFNEFLNELTGRKGEFSKLHSDSALQEKFQKIAQSIFETADVRERATLARLYSEAVLSATTGYRLRVGQNAMVSLFSSSKNAVVDAGGGKTEAMMMDQMVQYLVLRNGYRGEIQVENREAAFKYKNRDSIRNLAAASGLKLADGSELQATHKTGELIQDLTDNKTVVILDPTSRGHLRNTAIGDPTLRNALMESNIVAFDEVHFVATGTQQSIIGDNLRGPERAEVKLTDRLLAELLPVLRDSTATREVWSEKDFRDALAEMKQPGSDLKVVFDGRRIAFSDSYLEQLDGRFNDRGAVMSIASTVLRGRGDAGTYDIMRDSKSGREVIMPINADGRVEHEQISHDVIGQIAAARLNNLDPYKSVRVQDTTLSTGLGFLFENPYARLVGASATLERLERLMGSRIGNDTVAVSPSVLSDILSDGRVKVSIAGEKGLNGILTEAYSAWTDRSAFGYKDALSASRANLLVFVERGEDMKAATEFFERQGIAPNKILKIDGGSTSATIDAISKGVDKSGLADPNFSYGREGRVVLINRRGMTGIDNQWNARLIAYGAESVAEQPLIQLAKRVGRPDAQNAGRRFEFETQLVIRSRDILERSLEFEKHQLDALNTLWSSEKTSFEHRQAAEYLARYIDPATGRLRDGLLEANRQAPEDLKNLLMLRSYALQADINSDAAKFVIQETLRGKFVLRPLQDTLARLPKDSEAYKRVKAAIHDALNGARSRSAPISASDYEVRTREQFLKEAVAQVQAEAAEVARKLGPSVRERLGLESSGALVELRTSLRAAEAELSYLAYAVAYGPSAGEVAHSFGRADDVAKLAETVRSVSELIVDGGTRAVGDVKSMQAANRAWEAVHRAATEADLGRQAKPGSSLGLVPGSLPMPSMASARQIHNALRDINFGSLPRDDYRSALLAQLALASGPEEIRSIVAQWAQRWNTVATPDGQRVYMDHRQNDLLGADAYMPRESDKVGPIKQRLIDAGAWLQNSVVPMIPFVGRSVQSGSAVSQWSAAARVLESQPDSAVAAATIQRISIEQPSIVKSVTADAVEELGQRVEASALARIGPTRLPTPEEISAAKDARRQIESQLNAARTVAAQLTDSRIDRGQGSDIVKLKGANGDAKLFVPVRAIERSDRGREIPATAAVDVARALRVAEINNVEVVIQLPKGQSDRHEKIKQMAAESVQTHGSRVRVLEGEASGNELSFHDRVAYLVGRIWKTLAQERPAYFKADEVVSLLRQARQLESQTAGMAKVNVADAIGLTAKLEDLRLSAEALDRANRHGLMRLPDEVREPLSKLFADLAKAQNAAAARRAVEAFQKATGDAYMASRPSTVALPKSAGVIQPLSVLHWAIQSEFEDVFASPSFLGFDPAEFKDFDAYKAALLDRAGKERNRLLSDDSGISGLNDRKKAVRELENKLAAALSRFANPKDLADKHLIAALLAHSVNANAAAPVIALLPDAVGVERVTAIAAKLPSRVLLMTVSQHRSATKSPDEHRQDGTEKALELVPGFLKDTLPAYSTPQKVFTLGVGTLSSLLVSAASNSWTVGLNVLATALMSLAQERRAGRPMSSYLWVAATSTLRKVVDISDARSVSSFWVRFGAISSIAILVGFIAHPAALSFFTVWGIYAKAKVIAQLLDFVYGAWKFNRNAFAEESLTPDSSASTSPIDAVNELVPASVPENAGARTWIPRLPAGVVSAVVVGLLFSLTSAASEPMGVLRAAPATLEPWTLTFTIGAALVTLLLANQRAREAAWNAAQPIRAIIASA